MWTNNYGKSFGLKYKSRLINIEIEIPDEKSLVWPCTSSSSLLRTSLLFIVFNRNALLPSLSLLLSLTPSLWLDIFFYLFICHASPALIHLSHFSIWERLFILFTMKHTICNKCTYVCCTDIFKQFDHSFTSFPGLAHAHIRERVRVCEIIILIFRQ